VGAVGRDKLPPKASGRAVQLSNETSAFRRSEAQILRARPLGFLEPPSSSQSTSHVFQPVLEVARTLQPLCARSLPGDRPTDGEEDS
jgi:hypothetical protein